MVLGDTVIPKRMRQPDWNLAYTSLRDWKAIGASAIGKLHIRGGKQREDAFAISWCGPLIAVAVADGVGSKPLSGAGAAYAVSKFCSMLPCPEEVSPPSVPNFLKLFTSEEISGLSMSMWFALNQGSPSRTGNIPLGTLMRNALLRTRSGLMLYARSIGASPSDLACTLLALLLNVDTDEAVLAQIGDGAIIGHSEQGTKLMIEPKLPGEAGVTFTLTQVDWLSILSVKSMRMDEIRTLFIMTDGVADDVLYGPPADIMEKWASDMDGEIRRYPLHATSLRLLSWLSKYEAGSSWDDRTLVVMFR